jgi:hypothetical protein
MSYIFKSSVVIEKLKKAIPLVEKEIAEKESEIDLELLNQKIDKAIKELKGLNSYKKIRAEWYRWNNSLFKPFKEGPEKYELNAELIERILSSIKRSLKTKYTEWGFFHRPSTMFSLNEHLSNEVLCILHRSSSFHSLDLNLNIDYQELEDSKRRLRAIEGVLNSAELSEYIELSGNEPYMRYLCN